MPFFLSRGRWVNISFADCPEWLCQLCWLLTSVWYFSVVPCCSVEHIDGLVQERPKSSALAMELRLSCTNPSTCWYVSGMARWWDIGCPVSYNGSNPWQLWGRAILDLLPAFSNPALLHNNVVSVNISWPILKTESCHDTNFVVTGGSSCCHYDNLLWLPLCQPPVSPVTTKLASWQHSVFSLKIHQCLSYLWFV